MKYIFNLLLLFNRDRFRTAVNVEGDSIGAGIIAHMSRNELNAAADDTEQTDDGDGAKTRGFDSRFANGGIGNPAYAADESACTGL